MPEYAEPNIVVTDAPDPADTAVVQEGLRAYNTAQAGRDDSRPLAIFVTDPESGKVVGGLFGGSYLGQLRVDRFFLPEGMRRGGIGSRLLALAEAEGRRRGCTRIALNTLEIQARGFYEKQGYDTAATLDCEPPGVTRYLMSKRL
jgi:GNAT superfamily N-acetyltransferase